ncbi:S41 family peptidase [Candidatus Saccharibacteria bacterium]|nr:S41 family peptidase [Candidatus Saccharibacteria bacterium]
MGKDGHGSVVGKSSVYLIVALFIFGLGWSVGSGKLQFSVGNMSSTQNNQLPDKLDYSSVDLIYSELKSKYDGELSEADLISGLKEGLVKSAGDPYTEYMSPEDAKEFNDSLGGTFEGIGAELGKDEKGNIIIISPIAGYPAKEAGLMPKDIIVEIDDESASDITISEAVDRIRGEKDTDVKLGIIRSGEFKEYTITRQEINIPSVKTEIRDQVGIMTISRFGDDTVALARQAADEFVQADVKAVVLDLRGNTGGYLRGAVDVSGLWLDGGSTILTERRGEVIVDTLKASGTPKLKGIKTVILINEGSASASEIVAGALKDNGKAELLGQQTYGKGSVQEPIQLADGGILKVTIARWYTPNGKNIDKEGIAPDYEVEMTVDDIRADKDPQLDAALQKLQ